MRSGAKNRILCVLASLRSISSAFCPPSPEAGVRKRDSPAYLELRKHLASASSVESRHQKQNQKRPPTESFPQSKPALATPILKPADNTIGAATTRARNGDADDLVFLCRT